MARKKGPRRPFKTFVLGFGVALLVVAGGGTAFLYDQFLRDLPPVERLLDYEPPVATRVLAADGSILAEFFVEKRYVEPIYKIPRVVQLAFVAAEDATFYDHHGIDAVSIGRAALENFRAGATRQGGSTITQQVIKALLLSPERSYERKIKEMFLALQLERALTKDEILYLYLNQIYLGSGAYGVQAAARNYFDKDVSELTLAEAALLAGLPQAPSRYSPRHHMDRARARQRYVLRQMRKAGFVTREEAVAAEGEEILLAPPSRKAPTGETIGPARHFVEYVRRYLVKRYGGTAAYKLGLDVYTTLDPVLQAEAERAVREGIVEIDDRQGFRGPRRTLPAEQWRPLLDTARPTPASDLPAPGSSLDVVVVPDERGGLRRATGGVRVLWAGGRSYIGKEGFAWAARGGYKPRAGDLLQALVEEADGERRLVLAQDNGTQGALLAMQPQTGDIVAMVGGVDYDQSEFNRATQALRQPGSAFKPLVYTAALDRGFTPATVIQDTPVTYRIGPGQQWSPKNFSKKFFGPTTLREGLTKSRNVVTVKLTQAMGLNYLLDYLPRFGLERPIQKNLSIALGTAEMTLLEMVEAYGVFANLGTRVEPRFITAITDREGRLLEEIPVRSEAAIAPETAYMTVNLMRSVVEHGTGRRARLDRPVAGKTGTTNDLRDAWFIGYTPQLLTGVWVGYDQDRTLGRTETGGRSAAPIWKSFMQEALEDAPVQDFAVPSDIILVNVDKHSGERSRPGAPGAMIEAFRRGTEPTRPPPADAAYATIAPGDGPAWDGDGSVVVDRPDDEVRRWGDRPDDEVRRWGDRPDDEVRRWGDRTGAAPARGGIAESRPTWNDPDTVTRRWGDRPDSDAGTRRWGDRPEADPYRRRWGDAADGNLPGWARSVGEEPMRRPAAPAVDPREETNRWSRSLNTRRLSRPAPFDPASPGGQM